MTQKTRGGLDFATWDAATKIDSSKPYQPASSQLHPSPPLNMPPKSGKKGGAADKGKNGPDEERPDPLQALVSPPLPLSREKKYRVMRHKNAGTLQMHSL